MPRPGPRPYECVRRAWHSERHHPIRGSLIQEIFRIANEIHSPATKKKKEWQEKLPIVVLKAEEIMYSKANSEVEYMDLKTLRDRVNDAINTIIRREEGSEDTGEFLQPCIEAALHLGCFPRRASRSQRNNNHGGYLSGNPESKNVTDGNPKPTSSLTPHYSNFLGKEQCCLNNEPFLSSQIGLPCQGSFSSQPYAVFPLYYGSCSQPIEPQLMISDHPPSKSISNSYPSSGIPQNFCLFAEETTKNRIDPPKNPMNLSPKECDLSLRLGFSSTQNDVDNTKAVRSKKSKETFSLYHESDSGSSDDLLDINLMGKKRKSADQSHHSWKPKFLENYSNEGTSTAG
ncbi:unnamed protein product [Amaranthus hypochondriacus]